MGGLCLGVSTRHGGGGRSIDPFPAPGRARQRGARRQYGTYARVRRGEMRSDPIRGVMQQQQQQPEPGSDDERACLPKPRD